MKLSVVIPIYNVERWLPACLDSVLDPACEDYEILAVNDGSTDRSGEIAADYAARRPDRIRVISTPNGGLGHARNTGLEAARGDYLLFLDSDDRLAPGALREMTELLGKGGVDLLALSVADTQNFGIIRLIVESAQVDPAVGISPEYVEPPQAKPGAAKGLAAC